MGLFGRFFGFSQKKELAATLNPLLAMNLQEFVVLHDEPPLVKHYFRFRNQQGLQEEFIVLFRPADDPNYLRYVSTQHRKPGETEYLRLAEGPWSIAISYLVRMGQELPWATSQTERGGNAKTGGWDSVEELMAKGWELIEKQSLDDAIAVYSTALELQPARAELYFFRGIARSNKYFNRGGNRDDLEAAVADYTRAIECKPDYGEAFFQRAGLYSRIGNTAKAIADYGEAIIARHKVFSSHFARAKLWEHAGDHAKALEEFGAAVKAARDDSPMDRASVFSSRGWLQQKLGKHDLAVADFTVALAADSEMTGVYIARAMSLKRLGRFQEAIVDLGKAIEATTPSGYRITSLADLHTERAQCWSEMGQDLLAKEDIGRAKQLRQQG